MLGWFKERIENMSQVAMIVFSLSLLLGVIGGVAIVLSQYIVGMSATSIGVLGSCGSIITSRS